MSDGIDLWLEDLHRGRVGLTLRLRECLFSATTPFQRIAVYDSHAFGRVLCLGGEIAISDADERVYAEQLVHPALSSHPAPARILILGGGDGGVARECLRHAAVRSVTVVEIDSQVVECAKRFFPAAGAAFADERLTLVIDDAHRFLDRDATKFDAIIIDACDLLNPASRPFHEAPFERMVATHLAEGGMLVCPLGNPLLEPEHARETLDALDRPQVYVMSVPTQTGGQLAVAVASARRLAGVPAAQEWHAGLASWHPLLQPALFALPRHVERALGLR